MAHADRLDRIDRAILGVLAKDARTSNKDLATLVGLSASRCWERVRSLKERGVLRGAHVDVDPTALDIGVQAMVAIRLQRQSHPAVEAFRGHTLALPEVVALYHVAGANDFLVHVCAHDPDHLRDFAMTAFTDRPEVAHVETALVFEFIRKPGLPDYVEAD